MGENLNGGIALLPYALMVLIPAFVAGYAVVKWLSRDKMEDVITDKHRRIFKGLL